MMRKQARNNLDSPVFKDIVWGSQHDAFENELGQSLLRAWSLGACDEQIARLIHDQVRPLQLREAFGELCPFRKPRLSSREVILGKDTTGELIGIPLQWLAAGLLLVGNTGCGKSLWTAFLSLFVSLRGCRIWISDMYKTQARHLRRLLQRAGLDLIILRSRDWKCNLLQAGRCDPRMHLPMAVDLLSRILDLPPRARIIVRQGCHQLYEKFGVWKGRTYVWPCLFDLYEWTRSTEGLNAAAREAILDRLGALLTALTPDCGAYRLAWDPTDLARFSIVFEMRGAPEFVKQIQLEPPLYSLLQHEVEKGSVNRRISLLVAFEDSQRFFNAEQHAGGAEIAPMDELASVTRGGGKGLFVVAQTMQGLSRGLIPNLATKIMGRLGSHEDYVRLGADLAMNSSQIDWARRNLKPGVFIGQVAEGDWREPFVFYAPLMKMPTDVDDREVAESVKALDVLPTVPATEFARWKPVDMISIRANATQSSCTPPLSEPELRFLRAVIENPGRPSSSYAKLARVSGKRAAEIRAKLVKAGYLREHSVAKSGRGRSAIVLEPLGPALAAVRTHQE